MNEKDQLPASKRNAIEAATLDKFAEMMIEKIESIDRDWTKPWFTESARLWPRNLSGRQYNGSNALMLMMHQEKEGYSVPIYGTFDAIQRLNLSARRPASNPSQDAPIEKEYSGEVVLKDGRKANIISFEVDPKTQLPREYTAIDRDNNMIKFHQWDINAARTDSEDESQTNLIIINKGEKSFPVIHTSFTPVHKETKEKMNWEDYKKLSTEEKQNYNVYPKTQVYRVFNVAQTNMETARPELYNKLRESTKVKCPFERDGLNISFPAVDEMIKKDLWHCKINPEKQDCAFYDIRKDEITVPMKEQFRDNESFYGTLFHEMTHSTGAEKRLNRFDESKGWGRSNNFYAREELVAEMGAALIGSKYGLKKHLKDDSASYLKSWLDSLKEEPKYIKTVLGDVQKAVSMAGKRIDLIQEKIEAYQKQEGHSKDFPDIYDIDKDGNTNEVAHEEKESSKEQEIAAKGLHR